MRVGNIGWRRRLRERECESWEYWMEKEAEGERDCESWEYWMEKRLRERDCESWEYWMEKRLRERDCESWEYWMEKEAEGERLCELGILDGGG